MKFISKQFVFFTTTFLFVSSNAFAGNTCKLEFGTYQPKAHQNLPAGWQNFKNYYYSPTLDVTETITKTSSTRMEKWGECYRSAIQQAPRNGTSFVHWSFKGDRSPTKFADYTGYVDYKTDPDYPSTGNSRKTRAYACAAYFVNLNGVPLQTDIAKHEFSDFSLDTAENDEHEDSVQYDETGNEKPRIRYDENGYIIQQDTTSHKAATVTYNVHRLRFVSTIVNGSEDDAAKECSAFADKQLVTYYNTNLPTKIVQIKWYVDNSTWPAPNSNGRVHPSANLVQKTISRFDNEKLEQYEQNRSEVENYLKKLEQENKTGS